MFLWQGLGSGQFEMFGAAGVELEAHTSGCWLTVSPWLLGVSWCGGARSLGQQILSDLRPWLGLWGPAVDQSLSTTDPVILPRCGWGRSASLVRQALSPVWPLGATHGGAGPLRGGRRAGVAGLQRQAETEPGGWL